MNSNAVKMLTEDGKKSAVYLLFVVFDVMTSKTERQRSPNVVICVHETRQIMIYRLQRADDGGE